MGAAAVLSFRPIYEPDLWWHLAQGRENATGHVVRTNLFSFNYPDYRQQYTSWLFDTSAFLAWTAGGPTTIQMLQAAIVALTFGLVYVTCRIRSSVASAAAVLIVGFFILEPRAIPRPHLLSFAGLAACALLFERASIRRSAVPLWWCVPVIALWSNIHVECIFGVAFVALAAATESVRSGSLPSEEGRRTLVIALVCVVATLVNPYGWGLLQYAYENWSVPQVLDIAELQRPPLFAYRAFYVYLAGCAAVLIWQWRSVTLREVVTITAFAALGLRFIRLTPLVWLVSAPIVTRHLDAIVRRRAARCAVVVAAVCIGLLVSRIPVRPLFTGFAAGAGAVAPEAFFSSPAIAFVRQARLAGPVFKSHNLGGYLAWSLLPGGSNLPGRPAAGISARALPQHPRGFAIAARLGRARGRRGLGDAVSTPSQPVVGCRSLSGVGVGGRLPRQRSRDCGATNREIRTTPNFQLPTPKVRRIGRLAVGS